MCVRARWWLQDYEPGVILGKGTFGTTYLAKEKTSGEKYAIKVTRLAVSAGLGSFCCILTRGARAGRRFCTAAAVAAALGRLGRPPGS